MIYCTEADCAARMDQYGGLSATTNPTLAQASEIIAGRSARINAVLAGRGITVPVTAPSVFVDQLRDICISGSVSVMLRARYPDQDGPASEKSWKFFEEDWRAGLAGLKDGSEIPSSVVASSRVGPSTYFTRNPDQDETLGTNAEPALTMRMVW